MVVIGYHFYEDNSKRFFSLMRKLCFEFPGSSSIVVQNSSIKSNLNLDGLNKSKVISYCGEGWEFGAYQLGLDCIENELFNDGVIIINDTASINYPLYDDDIINIIGLIGEYCVSSVPVLIGKVELPARPMTMYERKLEQWVRTNIFYLNFAAICAINKKIYDEELFQSVTFDGENLGFPKIIGGDMREYIKNWMVPRENIYSWSEHVGVRNIDKSIVRGKTGSILHEKRLASLVQYAGGEILSYSMPANSLRSKFRDKIFYFKKKYL